MPVLDEARRIALRLEELSQRIPGIAEVIVVDGGSTDGTQQVVSGLRGVRLMRSPRGRGRQMNAGARAASGDILLFLHADVSLPTDAVRWAREALSDPTVVAGAFRTWTIDDTGRSWFGPLLHLADVRSRYSGLPYGDQALFVRRDVFERVGGFPEIPLMEDLELSRRLRRLGRIRVVPARVEVSGRRFVERPVFYTLLVNVFPLFYRLGVGPETLRLLYGDPR